MADKKTNKVPGLRITAKTGGFRRAGREWHGSTEVSLAELGREQTKMLAAEPMLVVERIEMVAEAEA